MTAAHGSSDALIPAHASQLLHKPLDPLRSVCLPVPGEVETRAALIGLANSKGGQVLLGVHADDARTQVIGLPGIHPSWLGAHVAHAIEKIDPPVDLLVERQTLPLRSGEVVEVLSIRQSPLPPHIDTFTGVVFLQERGIPRPIASRSELDQLYQKGRALNERAERLIEATVERLTMAHFGHYGIAVVACLREPAADPYLWASEWRTAFADPDDPFVRHWGLSADAARTSPGEVELRSDREVCGLLRVGRAGYVVAGEIMKRPHGDVLASVDEIWSQVSRLVATVCRVLGHSEAKTVIPRLLCDGLKGTRIRETEAAGSETHPCTVDVLRVAGQSGEACDELYQQHLSREFGLALLAQFGIRELPNVTR